MTISNSLSVLIIGFSGGRGRLYAECVSESKALSFDGVVKNRCEPELSHFSHKPTVYSNLSGALKARKWDVAIVSVPHASHDAITRALIKSGVRCIIKEKPLAIKSKEAQHYLKLMETCDLTFVTTTQRMIQPSFLKGYDMLSKIGEVRGFEYSYHFALPQMTSGWRAKKELSIGGVLLDMGYHALDVLHLYFGKMKQANGSLSYIYEEMAKQQLEDKADVELSFETVKGHLSINRHAKQKREVFEIQGTKGTLHITPKEVIFYDTKGKEQDRYTANVLSKKDQIHLLFDRCLKPEFKNWRDQAFLRNVDTVEAIESIYKNSSRNNLTTKE